MPRREVQSDHFSYDEVAALVTHGSTVLDLGCGDGELLQMLRDRRQVRGRGVEIEEEMILACVAKGINVFHGDLDEGLRDFATGSYDYVILNKTLQVVHEPASLIREMVRVGKRVIVNFPNFGYLKNRFQIVWRGRMPVNRELPYAWYDTPNIHFCTRSDFVDLCRILGVEVLSVVDLRQGRRIHGPLKNLRATECCFLLRGLSLAI